MKVRIGIIGCGSITKFRHGPEYKNNILAEIVGFYDPVKERAEEMVKLFGGRLYESYKELIDDADIEAVSVCTSNESHKEITIEAICKGKHVLCEKPMTIDADDAQAMVDTALKYKKILMLDHNQRLSPAHKRVKEIIENGELGRVLSFRTTFGHKGPEYWGAERSKNTWFFNKTKSGLGVIGDLGVHKIDLMRFLLDDEFETVLAIGGALHKTNEAGELIQVPDNIICMLKTKKGVIGSGTFSWTFYGKEDNSTIVYCEQGIIRIYDDANYSIKIEKLNGEEVFYKLEGMQTNDNQTSTGVIDAFINSIVNKQPPLISGEDGVRSMIVLQGIMRSLKTGVTIKL
ncbi:gfo/Idh/MocA family oxidoreductase [Clostridium bovifaecis]|uniref:Gfo/Idh/MocA family oxidoreductase n=1 Tax=Clostridium bovifaecis TaxID=2184719 RepID=A0A6I6ELR5_9CLOT|nr:gfo/Idh/MocA family oxidoreductase [Clostridium bovifaecis]